MSPRAREIPFESIPTHLKPLGLSQGRSEGFYGALMACAPNDVPQQSQEELLPLREVICDAIDRLTPEDRFVVEALTIERLSLRQLAVVLGVSKSSVANYRDRAMALLRVELENDPLVISHLKENQ